MSPSVRWTTVIFAAALLYLAAQRHSFAGSATWSTNPSSGDWNTAANWTPNTVPDGPSDIATFGTSSVTDLSIPLGSIVEVDKIIFNDGAPPYTISVEVSNLFLTGTGIVNNSGTVQTFMAPITQDNNGAIFFFNDATAGDMISVGGVGGLFVFENTSSAGSANFDITSGDGFQATLLFMDSATAADATITSSEFADIGVSDFASGGNAVFTLTTGAFIGFSSDATADRASVTCIGGNGIYGSSIIFSQFATAAEGHFTAIGGTTSGEAGSDITFTDSATAANGTFVINGGAAHDLAGALLTFVDTTTASNAKITATGGVGGAEGGAIVFEDRSKGGKASISLLGNSQLDITNRVPPGLTIGSLVGQGLVFLGANTLTIGSNNQSTTFSGMIQDTGGLTKIGTGTLTLSGANTHTGVTTVSAGVLRTANRTGSATGTGAVNVNAGILGGRGTINGPTTIGTGSGAGAFLAPGVGSNKPTTITIQSALTFNSDGTYTYNLDTRNAKADQVLANGVTIENGAQFNFSAVANKRLQRGQAFTAIANTSANPISGAFANLTDGSTFTAGRNKFQVSYSGGDGNDLTLTVVR